MRNQSTAPRGAPSHGLDARGLDARRARRTRAHGFIAIGLFAFGLTRCDYGEYPLPPTFCDDWCFTLRRIPCDQEPENCVRDCEADRTPSCELEHEALRQCYGSEPPQSFVCVGEGFGAQIRPLRGVCQAERDTLIACAAPDEWECLQVCRDVDARQPEESSEPLPDEAICPRRDIPCANLCRGLSDGDVSEAVQRLGGTQSVPLESARVILECAAERGRSCREAARAGVASVIETWQAALVRCALANRASDP